MHRDLHRELRKVRRGSGAARPPRPAIGMGVAVLAAGGDRCEMNGRTRVLFSATPPMCSVINP